MKRKTEERDRKLQGNETNLRQLFGAVPASNEIRQAYDEKMAVVKTEQVELNDRIAKLKSSLESKRNGQKIHQGTQKEREGGRGSEGETERERERERERARAR